MKLHAAIFDNGHALCGVKRTKDNTANLLYVFDFKPHLKDTVNVCTKCQAMAKRVLLFENVNID